MHKLFNELQHYLEAAQLMVVACSKDNTPYASTVYFSFDEDLHIYFMSGTHRRHSKEILENPHVSLAIASHRFKWTDKKEGLQIEGTCVLLKGDEAKAAFENYALRFPDSAYLREEFDGVDMWEVTPFRGSIWDENKYDHDGRRIEF